MYIDHNFFRNKLYKFTGRVFDLVSTIDHPYSSPPARLVDGHSKLKKLSEKGLKPLVCIWDVNFPNLNNYRQEIIFDSGVLGSKDKKFFISDVEREICKQAKPFAYPTCLSIGRTEPARHRKHELAQVLRAGS